MAWTPPGSTDVCSNLFKSAANFLTETFPEIGMSLGNLSGFYWFCNGLYVNDLNGPNGPNGHG